MWRDDQYTLLDFGDGRRLERFAGHLLDRPAPPAEGERRARPALWSAATRYERISEQRGRWTGPPLPERWQLDYGPFRLELKPTKFGHLGVFPEQAANWDWLADTIAAANRPLKLLNLFAYTGGSTLAAAAAGAEVVHVDAAKNVAQWARRNAELSGLAAAPIRWIAEDAQKFVTREVRRGNQYDGVILDPPSYGHGPKGEVWKLAEQLPTLLAQCAALTTQRRALMLITCHSPGFGPRELAAALRTALPHLPRAQIEAHPLTIPAATGRELPSGALARWAG